MTTEFEKKYLIKGDLRLSYINSSGMVFQIKPLLNLNMDANQIKAELKVATIKLNEAVIKWDSQHIDKQRVKEAWLMFKLGSKPNKENEILSEEVRGQIFEKQLGLNTVLLGLNLKIDESLINNEFRLEEE